MDYRDVLCCRHTIYLHALPEMFMVQPRYSYPTFCPWCANYSLVVTRRETIPVPLYLADYIREIVAPGWDAQFFDGVGGGQVMIVLTRISCGRCIWDGEEGQKPRNLYAAAAFVYEEYPAGRSRVFYLSSKPSSLHPWS